MSLVLFPQLGGLLQLVGRKDRPALTLEILAEILHFLVLLVVRKSGVTVNRLHRLALLVPQGLHFRLLVGGQAKFLGHVFVVIVFSPVMRGGAVCVRRGRRRSGRGRLIVGAGDGKSTKAGPDGEE